MSRAPASPGLTAHHLRFPDALTRRKPCNGIDRLMNAAPTREARFVTGSIMRHVAVMTFTGALGLMSMFLVDLADLFFLSLLGKTEDHGGDRLCRHHRLHQSVAVHRHRHRRGGPGCAQSRRQASGTGARIRHELSSCIRCISVARSDSLIALAADGLLRLLGAHGEALHLAKLFIWTASPGFVLPRRRRALLLHRCAGSAMRGAPCM